MSLHDYKKVQTVAKQVHENLELLIKPDSTERSIVEAAKALLLQHGITDTRYYDVPAFVLLGSRSCLSISGKDYTPHDEKVGQTNLVTVNLSPRLGDIWGDCARSYYIENGVCTRNPQFLEFQEGALIQAKLHKSMTDFVTPDTLLSELYEFGNKLINANSYENLDFLSNLGHSIEIEPAKRRFIDQTCQKRLGSLNFLTFEPHIRKTGKNWGFKHEEIYYFNGEGKAVAL